MRTFISNNGMEALAGMIDSDNLYLRGQVLEIILSATDCDVYDWFKSPALHVDKVLHQNMLGFARSSVTMAKLFANRVGSYPGGSFRALQIIAFLLSWIRALYTTDQKLQLSPHAISSLRLWATTESASTATTANPTSTAATSEDPEVQLANALLDDFTSSMNQATSPQGEATAGTTAGPTAPTTTASVVALSDGDEDAFMLTAIDASSLAAEAAAGIPPQEEGAFFSETGSSTVAEEASRETTALDERAPVTPEPAAPTSISSALELKEQGNAAFKQGQYREATTLYLRALEVVSVVDPVEAEESQEEVCSSLHTNTATALWKIAQDLLAAQPELELALDCAGCLPGCAPVAATSSVDAPLTQLLATLEECTLHCQKALATQPSNTKAAYRLAAVLLLQRQSSEALRVTLCCLQAASSTTTTSIQSAGSAAGDAEVLQQMRRRCAAAVLLEQSDAARRAEAVSAAAAASESRGGNAPAVDLGMSGKARAVLRDLLVQYQIELDLPADSTTMATAGSVANVKPLIVAPVPASAPTPALPVATVGPAASTAAVDGAKTEKKKKKKAAAGGTTSLAKRLQEIDDNMLESLMKRSSIKN